MAVPFHHAGTAMSSRFGKRVVLVGGLALLLLAFPGSGLTRVLAQDDDDHRTMKELTYPQWRELFRQTYPDIQALVKKHLDNPKPVRTTPESERNAEVWRALLLNLKDQEMTADMGPALLVLAQHTPDDAPCYGEMLVMLTLMVDRQTPPREKDHPLWVEDALSDFSKRPPFPGAAGLIALAQLDHLMNLDAVLHIRNHKKEIYDLAGSLPKTANLRLMLDATGNTSERFDEVDVELMILAERNNAAFSLKTPAEKAAELQKIVNDITAITRKDDLTGQQRKFAERLRETLAKNLREFQMQSGTAPPQPATNP